MHLNFNIMFFLPHPLKYTQNHIILPKHYKIKKIKKEEKKTNKTEHLKKIHGSELSSNP